MIAFIYSVILTGSLPITFQSIIYSGQDKKTKSIFNGLNQRRKGIVLGNCFYKAILVWKFKLFCIFKICKNSEFSWKEQERGKGETAKQ